MSERLDERAGDRALLRHLKYFAPAGGGSRTEPASGIIGAALLLAMSAQPVTSEGPTSKEETE